MGTEVNKLVRDQIPEIIRQGGNECEVKFLSDTEYLTALRNKLIEEAQEAASATKEDLVEELADLYEVIDSILVTLNIERVKVFTAQIKKRKERGGFEQRIQLLWTEGN